MCIPARSEPTSKSPEPEGKPGIVITEGAAPRVPGEPLIAAFMWGGEARPAPTLPFGRWKGAA